MKDESCVIVRCSTIGGDIGGDARWSMHDAFVTGEEAAAEWETLAAAEKEIAAKHVKLIASLEALAAVTPAPEAE